jgi:hypothetical protein
MDNGASIHMKYDRSLFRAQNKKGNTIVDLGDETTYPVRGVDSIFFQMPSSDVIEMSDILLVISLRKNLILVSCMTYIY